MDTGEEIKLGQSLNKNRISRLRSDAEVIKINRGAEKIWALGRKQNYANLYTRKKNSRLWSDAEVITINRGAERVMDTGAGGKTMQIVVQ